MANHTRRCRIAKDILRVQGPYRNRILTFGHSDVHGAKPAGMIIRPVSPPNHARAARLWRSLLGVQIISRLRLPQQCRSPEPEKLVPKSRRQIRRGSRPKPLGRWPHI
jgi:hypothetical protein